LPGYDDLASMIEDRAWIEAVIAAKNLTHHSLASGRLQHTLCRSRVLHQPVRRPDRTANEFAATVRTDPMEFMLRTVCAERALIGTDPRIETCRRQVPIAALAVGTKFQHLLGRHRHIGWASQNKSLVTLRRHLVAFLPIGADAADIGHEHPRFARDIGAHVPGGGGGI
jgi:hypothetical protein